MFLSVMLLLRMTLEKDICQNIGWLHVLHLYFLIILSAILVAASFPRCFHLFVQLNHTSLSTCIRVTAWSMFFYFCGHFKIKIKFIPWFLTEQLIIFLRASTKIQSSKVFKEKSTVAKMETYRNESLKTADEIFVIFLTRPRRLIPCWNVL